MKEVNATKGEYSISTDKKLLDLNLVHHFLANESYWSKNIPFEIVKTAAENSLTFGIYLNKKQVGYARIITDYATIAYLGDVFILNEHRGLGLSKWLMEQIHAHPNLQGLRRWVLLTADAHALYKKFGWTEIANPDRYLEKVVKDIYLKK